MTGENGRSSAKASEATDRRMDLSDGWKTPWIKASRTKHPTLWPVCQRPRTGATAIAVPLHSGRERTPCVQASRGEPEMQHVAVGDRVILAFQPQLAGV